MFAVVLFFAAWVGHCYLLMLVLNWTYAHPFQRTFLKLMRLVCGLMLGVPPVVALFVGYDIAGFSRAVWEDGTNVLAAAYIWLCVGLGGVAFPVATVCGLLRRKPPQVRHDRTTTIDVAKELGRRPVGHGKHHWIAAQMWNNIFQVDFTTLTVAIPDLPPAWDGLSILQISDLHFCGTLEPAYYQWVLRRAMQDGVPDVVALTGDVIDGEPYLAWIEPVLCELRWNSAAFAILGNHDWWQDAEGVRARLAQLGLTVVGNRWTTHDVRGEALVVIGHEGPWFRPAPDLSSAPAGFRLLLSHTPDNITWARRHGVQLMLSGHNHGGQVRLPLIGSLFVPSKYSRRYDMGTFFRAPTLLHVNRGLGGKEPIRLRCRPQVTRLILHRAPS